MAFGFLKKREYADRVFFNGHIYTQDPEFPWAEAVAVKDGLIMAVGHYDGMEDIIGSDTEEIDLDGKFLFPGFIDAHRGPVMQVFQDKYLDLSDCTTREELLELVSEWAEDHPEYEVVFGYGYKEELKPGDEFEMAAGEESDTETDCSSLEEKLAEEDFGGNGISLSDEEMSNLIAELGIDPEDADGITIEIEEVEEGEEGGFFTTPSAAFLSQAVCNRPVLLLGSSTIDCWTNEMADSIILQAAEDEVVDTITVSYVLNLLLPFDFEEIEEEAQALSDDLSDQGFTGFVNLQAPEYFENIFMDAVIGQYNEETLRQRFFGSYMMNRPLNPRGLAYRLMNRKTTCLEMNDLIHADLLNLVIDNEHSPMPFTNELLQKVMMEVVDKGFGIYCEAFGHDDVIMAYDLLEYIRSKGYKNRFIIASDVEVTMDEMNDYMHWESAVKTWGTDLFASVATAGFTGSPEERIEELTTVPAKMLGMESRLGTIEKGKYADFSIFSENLLELRSFRGLHADMTVLNGEVVYDVEKENEEEMLNFIMSQHM